MADTCGYHTCVQPITVDGPSLDFHDETCQKLWHERQLRTVPLESAPLPASPPPAPLPPRITAVAVDEATQITDHAWAAAINLLDQPAPSMAEARMALAVSRRPGWVRRILGGH